MGNQLVSSVKTSSVIRSIEYYLSEVPDIKLKSSLGQTQFLKVALCFRENEGEVVVKVLSHEDPSLLLDSHRKELIEFANITRSNSSIASFRIVEIRPNFAYIVRQYVRFSLYDRLSTRPFMTDIEKCWIVYQILRCLAWCHERKLYHGDIKLENILVTSNMWVIMTDFATYKPVNLPEDNPSFFNYFFDTSRRRCCNIAPERFVSTASLAQMDNQPSTIHGNNSSASLPSLGQESNFNEAMDMFSIGCVLVEIFSDNFMFDYSSLLLYKENRLDQTQLENKLSKIDSPIIRDLAQNLISLEPGNRTTCSQALNNLKGIIFPTYFGKLYNIMRTLIRLSPDSKILYLIQELPNYLPAILSENPNGVLIILLTITSSLRSLTHVHCKIQAQRLIVELVRSSTQTLSPYIIDRLIPYLAHSLTNDSDHRVRAEAICSLTDLLEQVAFIQASDSNIFTDFLMEILIKSLESEKSVFVRLRMAQNIGRLSAVAFNFLNQSCDQNYDEELALLHQDFAQLVVQLLTDVNNCVRRTLLLTPRNCSHLCTFFGRQKTTDVILPHIFTFLNHKNFQLRLSFFDNIIVIASYLGVQCSTILQPLLQIGLQDAEEVIIGKTINSIASLAEQGLLQKNIIYELLQEILPLFYHPNLWIVHSIVHLFTVLAEHLSIIDLHCKIIPMLTPYLSRHIHSLSSKHLLLESLKPRLPREVLDIVFSAKDDHVLQVLFEILRNKSSGLNNAPYKRLCAENIDSYMEDQLLKLSDLFTKIYRNRKNRNQNRDECGSEIEYHNYDRLIRSIHLVDPLKDIGTMGGSGTTNQEWQHMFGPRSPNEESNDLPMISDAVEAKEIEVACFDCPPSRSHVRALMVHKKTGYTPSASLPQIGTFTMEDFRPRGLLVSHLNEHKASVNAIARYGTTSCFFTCSDDGTIRIWDLANFENRHVINRSKYLFKMEFSNGSPINFKGVVCCGPYVITYTNDGIIYIFESQESCLRLVCNFKVGSSKSSIPLLISSICTLSSNIFAVSLTNSIVYGYDVRNIHTRQFFVPIFKVALSPHHRTITSIDGNEVILFLATATGKIAGFDLRFKLNVIEFDQTSSSNQQTVRITKIKYSPEGLYTSTHGSSDITLWDYKLGHRITVLRASGRQQDKSSTFVNAILPISNKDCTVITGGSDMRIRLWDINSPEKSYVISDPTFKACCYLGSQLIGNNSPSMKSLSSIPPSAYSLHHDHISGAPPISTYISKRVGDHQVIEEFDSSPQYAQYNSKHHCSMDQQSIESGHQDAITDLLRVNHFLISSGRNGTIKVWR
ncbi:phosphoinositide-3-kinase, regulatory subunit 4 [Blomia tropicalis]|nr:phosphoinositide-3-kinase, regulatory subunit 4 [Blomia tropicalis]